MNLSSFYFISNPIEQYLTKEDMARFNRLTVRKTYEKSAEIFRENTYPKGAYILRKGKVKLFQKTLTGAEQIMNIYVAGEIFGYRPLLSEERYPASATALEPCVISFIPKKSFLEFIEQSPGLSNVLLKFLSREFTVWVNTVSLFSSAPVKERLLLNLLILTEKYRTTTKWPVAISLSKGNLASLIGTSNETLARIIKALRDDDLISTKGRLIIIKNQDQYLALQKALRAISMLNF